MSEKTEQNLITLSLILVFLAFCGLLVYFGHWITGAVIAGLVLCSINVTEGNGPKLAQGISEVNANNDKVGAEGGT